MGSHRNDEHVLVVGRPGIRADESGADPGADDLADVVGAVSAVAPSPTVETVPTVEAAVDRLADASVTCVITAADLPDGTGISLCRRIREDHPELPVVFQPTDGSEALASEAVAAGVTEYVPGDAETAELERAVERAVEAGRRRREEAVTALHRTARRLLYAETTDEIAEIVIEDAAGVLDLEASAVFLFEEGKLRPAVHSNPMEQLCGPPTNFEPTGDNTVGYSYIEHESLFLAGGDDPPVGGQSADGDAAATDSTPESVVTSSLPANPSTDVQSAAYVPLGDYGVFVAGSESVDRFDPVTRELAALLSAAAEAALERVTRESELREQERTLQRRNRRLERLDRINEIIREVDGALVRAGTREEIERAVCDRLTADDRFSFAWIGSPSPGSNELESSAWDGDGQGYLDSVSFPVDGGTEPACRTAETREVTVVSNVAGRLHDESWRPAALSRGFQSVISVPLAYDEFTYGVLTVYADRPNAFDEVAGPVLEELGETIASAMGAVERKSALLTVSSTRLEFDVRDENDVFGRLAREADCTVRFDGGVRRTADGTWVFATVEGASVETVAAVARDLIAVEAVQVIHDDGGRGTFRLRFSEPFFALRLVDHGVVLHSVEATPEDLWVVVDVPAGVDSRNTVRVVETAFDDVSLVSKGTVERTNARDLRSTLLEQLTDRQLEVVQVAYYGGFFESPRETTGEEVAETLGISPAAFYRHNRTVQRKLIETLFEEGGLPASIAHTVE